MSVLYTAIVCDNWPDEGGGDVGRGWGGGQRSGRVQLLGVSGRMVGPKNTWSGVCKYSTFII